MIALENVHLRFDSRGIAGLSGVDLTLREGTVTALLGPNGSGKTTLLRILAGELKPDSGKVMMEEAALFARIPEASPELNVQKFLISRTQEEIPEEKRIQLTRDLADIFEFTFQLRQKMGELSAGQRQKVFLAGELIRGPRLVLLDEPFTHLDPQTRKDILKSLFEYVRRQNLTLLWVTHDLDEAARFSDQLVIVQHGKIEQQGSPEEVISLPKNIFVAHFVGYHNFFPVKKSGNVWSTPWGEKEFISPLEGPDAILVVPDTAWVVEKNSAVKVEVEEQYFRNTLRTIEVMYGDKRLVLQGHFPSTKPGQKIGLTPRFEACFLISL